MGDASFLTPSGGFDPVVDSDVALVSVGFPSVVDPAGAFFAPVAEPAVVFETAPGAAAKLVRSGYDVPVHPGPEQGAGKSEHVAHCLHPTTWVIQINAIAVKTLRDMSGSLSQTKVHT